MNGGLKMARPGRAAVALTVVLVMALVLGLAVLGAGLSGGGMLLGASGCPGGSQASYVATVAQPAESAAGQASIPADYLRLYQQAGRAYNVPWVILAGIGEVESDHGRSSLPGVHSGANAFGAAGPMQIGIGGAAGNQWGGAPVHPASQQVAGVATDGNGDGVASVYEPADAIDGAAKYLVAHGVQVNPSGAIFAYNHLQSYVQAVLSWAGSYARGGFVVTPGTGAAVTAAQCLASGHGGERSPGPAAAAAVSYAAAQLGKPYLWGATGPDAFDCSGLVMMAYRSAGVDIPRTSQQQWAWGQRVPAGHEQPGDLVFFAGADGTASAPGHVGLVIGHGLMIEAYSAGFPVRIAAYAGRHPVGFTRPWARPGVTAGSS